MKPIHFWIFWILLVGKIALAQDNRVLTFEEAKRLADQGDAYGEAIVAFHYSVGWQTEKNLELAAKYAISSTQKGHPLGAFRLGALLRSGDGVPKNEAQGLDLQSKAIAGLDKMAGNPYALTALGVGLFQGKVVREDKKMAAQLYKRAADMDFAPAQFNYAKCAEFGQGTSKDLSLANFYLKKSASLGYPLATDAIREINSADKTSDHAQNIQINDSTFVNKVLNFAEAKKLADQGNSFAEAVVAHHYSIGWQTSKDLGKANTYARSSALKGNSLGLYRLGMFYLSGSALEQNPTDGTIVDQHGGAGLKSVKNESKAYELIKKAIPSLLKQDTNPYAQSALGYLSESGIAVKQNFELAREYYQKSSAAGFAPAQSLLSGLLKNGHGGAVNVKESDSLIERTRVNNYPFAFTDFVFTSDQVIKLHEKNLDGAFKKEINTIIQRHPNQSDYRYEFQQACISADFKIMILANNSQLFYYEMPEGKLIKVIPVSFPESFQIKRVFHNSELSTTYVIVGKNHEDFYDTGLSNQKIYTVDSKHSINLLQDIKQKEVIGYDFLRNSFCVLDRQSKNLYELNFDSGKMVQKNVGVLPKFSEGGDFSGYFCFYHNNNIFIAVVDLEGSAADLPNLIAVYEFHKNQVISYLNNKDSIAGKSISGKNDASEKLLELMNIPITSLLSNSPEDMILNEAGQRILPNSKDKKIMKEPGFFSQNTILLDGSALSLEEWLLRCGDLSLLINSKNFEHRLNFLDNQKVTPLLESQIMHLNGFSTTADARKFIVWNNSDDRRVFDERGWLKENIHYSNYNSEKPLPWTFDLNEMKHKVVHSKYNQIWNGSISDLGDYFMLSGSEKFGYDGCEYDQSTNSALANASMMIMDFKHNSLITKTPEVKFQLPLADFEFGRYLNSASASEMMSVSFLNNLFSKPYAKWVYDGESVLNFDVDSILGTMLVNHSSNQHLYFENTFDSNFMSGAKLFFSNHSPQLLLFKSTIIGAFPLESDRCLVAFDSQVSLIDVSNKKFLSNWFPPEGSSITSMSFAHSANSIFLTLSDGMGYILDMNPSGNFSARIKIIGHPNKPPTFLTPNNEYASFSKSFDGIHFSDSEQTFPFEQFDLRLNRPDVVLERLGAPDEAIAIAKQIREKRLKRMGVTEDMLQPDFHLPEIEVVGDLPSSTAESELALKIKASDSKYPLDRLRVYVNNVPVNGKEGQLLRDAKSQTLERTIPIKLAAGRNKIQVSVLNIAGAESLYANAEVSCTAQRPKPTLYAVAMGVSEYSNPDWNLKYAAKDARDILECVKTRSSSSYGEIKELLLTDREATKESLGKIRDFLSKATVDDTVLMFVAGHGLLDSKYDYYFGTSDIDFNNPSGNGIAFEEFDDLLAELPCLRKSLLIDTCHAGELDEDEKKMLASAQANPSQVVSMLPTGARGMTIKPIEGARGKSEWYDRLQGLFVDLRRGSGSTILSSSAGAEYALESSEQKNGLFTYAVLEALDGKEGSDANKDGSVTMSELADYVKTRVAALTNNKQSPNVRRVNLEGDFALSKK